MLVCLRPQPVAVGPHQGFSFHNFYVVQLTRYPIKVSGNGAAGLIALAAWPTHRNEPASASITPTPTAKLNSGHNIPVLGLGTSGTTGMECTDAIVSAVAMGYRVRNACRIIDNLRQLMHSLLG